MQKNIKIFEPPGFIFFKTDEETDFISCWHTGGVLRSPLRQ